MAKLKLNLTDVKAGSEPIPPGKYPVEVVDADIRMGMESGKPYLWLHLKITEGDHANRRVFFQGTLDQNSDGLGITFATINALLRQDVTGQKYELDTDDLIGEEALATVDVEKGLEGEDRNRTKYLREFPEDHPRRIAREEEGERPWS